MSYSSCSLLLHWCRPKLSPSQGASDSLAEAPGRPFLASAPSLSADESQPLCRAVIRCRAARSQLSEPITLGPAPGGRVAAADGIELVEGDWIGEDRTMGTNTFLVLINQRSGGQDGPQLLDKFRTLAQEGLEGQQHLEVDKTYSQGPVDLMM